MVDNRIKTILRAYSHTVMSRYATSLKMKDFVVTFMLMNRRIH